MKDEDTNWFKPLPWWQKILVLLVGFVIAALFFLGPDVFGQINENKSQGPPEPILHVSVVSHFDQPWAMGIDDLNAFRTLTKNHPKMRWTHLYNPVAYTQLTPHYKKMESFVKKTRYPMNSAPLFLIIVTLPLLLGSVRNAELKTFSYE